MKTKTMMLGAAMVALSLGLGGCEPATPPASTASGAAPATGLPSASQIQTTLQQAGQTAQVVLTNTAALMCQAQSAANLAGAVALALGNSKDASAASKASTVAGLGCTWSPPPVPATPAVS